MEHDTGPGHPERSERLVAIYKQLEHLGLMAKAERLPLRDATPEELLRVHDQRLLDQVAATDGKAHGYLDGDTPTSASSYQAALKAAGGLIDATTAVINGDANNGFALVRPPGHHAERDQAMGFCLFNNVAVAAKDALERQGLSRILIVDWDVHHGNGTQHSFYDDPRVLFFSTHRYPFYPGTGAIDEVGEGAGLGYTVNVPLPAGMNDAVHDAAFIRVLTPVARDFKPELILVSAGFDSHASDPLGGMNVTKEGFGRMAGRVLGLADELCDGKVVATLEGGYDLDGLAGGVSEVVAQMMGEKSAPAEAVCPVEGFDPLVEKINECQGGKWPGLGDSN